MASSGPERSLSGISLPQWMKSKISDRYDLDQSTFSPPTEDDSFFYIRYPKPEPGPKHLQDHSNTRSVYRSINEVLQNHTLPCQDFIPSAKATPRELGMKKPIDPPLGVAKSAGTDDGFSGVGAACGQSVVAVAHQMISEGLLTRRQNSASVSSIEDDEFAVPPPAHLLARRRGSKSLPTSPQTSPKTLRKNPYFTNAMLGSTGSLVDKGRKQSWLLKYVRESQSLRGSTENLKLSEAASMGLAASPLPEESATSSTSPKTTRIRARPTQLREMNFWSPTSM